MIKLTNLLKEVYFSGFITTEEKSRFNKPENFDQYGQGKGWTAWRGGNDWENGCTAAAVVFEGDDKSRVWFSVKYPDNLKEYVGEGISTSNPLFEKINKFGKKVTNRWIREAQKIHRIPRDKEYGIKRDWKECFVMALGSKGMKPFVKECGIDYTTWKSMKRNKGDD